MAVKILVRRPVPEDKAGALRVLTERLRVIATGQPGHIAGETLKRVDKPGENLVVTKWRSMGAWQRWQETAERAQIQDQIDDLLGVPTEYEIYEYE